jgi:SAM-dependent methyltransferase
MDNLPFGEEELDLIWSEGAIYNIGFEEGLQVWRRYLKPGGYIAVSEASWFRDDPPGELLEYWNSEYPGIGMVSAKLAQMEGAGYLPVAVFALPENCWTDHFYLPQVAAQELFLKKHRGNKAAQDLVATMRHEAAMYERYSAYYGYAFYIGRKDTRT